MARSTLTREHQERPNGTARGFLADDQLVHGAIASAAQAPGRRN